MSADASRWLALIVVVSWGSGPPAGVAAASESCTASDPGDHDYCDPDECGACAEGEGDCDPGECRDGLVCVEEGDIDHCRAAADGLAVDVVGSSNLQVRIDGEWRGVCCDGHTLEVSDRSCSWTEDDRTLTDETEDREVDCPEGGPAECECDGSGERMHGLGGGSLNSSIRLPDGGPIYSNWDEETCVVVDADGELETEWSDGADCPDFRLL